MSDTPHKRFELRGETNCQGKAFHPVLLVEAAGQCESANRLDFSAFLMVETQQFTWFEMVARIECSTPEIEV